MTLLGVAAQFIEVNTPTYHHTTHSHTHTLNLLPMAVKRDLFGIKAQEPPSHFRQPILKIDTSGIECKGQFLKPEPKSKRKLPQKDPDKVEFCKSFLELAKSPFSISGDTNSPTSQLFANPTNYFSNTPKNNSQQSSNSKSSVQTDTSLNRHMQQSVNTLLNMRGSPTTQDSDMMEPPRSPYFGAMASPLNNMTQKNAMNLYQSELTELQKQRFPNQAVMPNQHSADKTIGIVQNPSTPVKKPNPFLPQKKLHAVEQISPIQQARVPKTTFKTLGDYTSQYSNALNSLSENNTSMNKVAAMNVQANPLAQMRAPAVGNPFMNQLMNQRSQATIQNKAVQQNINRGISTASVNIMKPQQQNQQNRKVHDIEQRIAYYQTQINHYQQQNHQQQQQMSYQQTQPMEKPQNYQSQPIQYHDAVNTNNQSHPITNSFTQPAYTPVRQKPNNKARTPTGQLFFNIPKTQNSYPFPNTTISQPQSDNLHTNQEQNSMNVVNHTHNTASSNQQLRTLYLFGPHYCKPPEDPALRFMYDIVSNARLVAEQTSVATDSEDMVLSETQTVEQFIKELVDELDRGRKGITELSEDYLRKIELNLKFRKVNQYFDQLESHYINNKQLAKTIDEIQTKQDEIQRTLDYYEQKVFGSIQTEQKYEQTDFQVSMKAYLQMQQNIKQINQQRKKKKVTPYEQQLSSLYDSISSMESTIKELNLSVDRLMMYVDSKDNKRQRPNWSDAISEQ